MEFVRTHTILSMLKGYPNIQGFDIEPAEVRGPNLTEVKLANQDSIIDGIIAAALALRRHRAVHPDFSLKNFRLVDGVPVLCNFDGCWLEEKYDYLPALQRCIRDMGDASLCYKMACDATSLKQLATMCDIPIPPDLHGIRTFQYTTRHNAIVEKQIKWLWNYKHTREFVAMLHEHAEITEELYELYQYHIYSRFDKPRVINYLVGNCANIRAISNDWVWEPIEHLPRMSECKFDVYQMFSVVQGITRAYAALEYWQIIHPFTIDCFRMRGNEPVLCDFSRADVAQFDPKNGEPFLNYDRKPMHALIDSLVGAAVPVLQPRIKIKRPAEPNDWTAYLRTKQGAYKWHKRKFAKFIGRHMLPAKNQYNHAWGIILGAVKKLFFKI